MRPAVVLFGLTLTTLHMSAGLAQGTANPSKERASVLDEVLIVGTREEAFRIPGSAHMVDSEEMRALAYDDVNRALRQVPGVYVREEDGYGLFPNISLRGVDSSRSAKVTIMEDGILAAPAPYAAPSAYYSPTAGRMSGIEILKGTSQIKFGPHTTGGAINYLSTMIPEEETTYLRAQFGDDNEYRVHAHHGGVVETAGGRVGYLAEFYLRSTDGFKSIDETPDFTDGDDTGFTNIEPMAKLFWEPNSSFYQRFEFKYGFTDAEADETYLGLSTSDLRQDAHRRYSASRFDNIKREHHRTYLRHFMSPTDSLNIVTTAYYNKFARNWYKLHDIRNIGGSGMNQSLSAALAGASSVFAGDGLACLKGELDCSLRVRANDRTYYSLGVQSEGVLRFEQGAVDHTLTVGVRYHNDESDRFQHQDTYVQAPNGSISNVLRGAAGSQDNREREAKAIATWIEDRIEYNRWWLTAGIRFEHLWLENRDLRPGRTSADTELDMLGGGVALGYQISDTWQAFGGVHFGFSPPSPGGAVGNGLEEETSVGYEIGVRYASTNGYLMGEIVGFLSEFEDLIVVNNIGGTGTGIDENFGEVESYGVEVGGQLDLGSMAGWSFGNIYHVAFTYTHATQQNDARSTDPESIFSFGRSGNDVPYIPSYQFNIGANFDFGRFGVNVNANFVDETFTSANNVSQELNGVGSPDARFGKTDSYETVDLTANYQLRSNTKVFAGVHNLFDAEYIVTRQPHGARAGLDQTWFTGIEFGF